MDHRKPDSDADARLRHAGAIAGFCYEASRLPLSEEEQNDVRALCLFMNPKGRLDGISLPRFRLTQAP